MSSYSSIAPLSSCSDLVPASCHIVNHWSCRWAWFLYLFYMAALGYYLYVRITKTLDLGKNYMWCAFVLARRFTCAAPA